ncbi:MAG TPA: hypothetical protein VMX54_11425 [Vicinamibacteria bacterium]|nr:hypothetical protein [Vicinamibacteria bacterium]
MSLASPRARWCGVAAFAMALAVAATGFADGVYYEEIARDGRIYVFADARAAGAFQKSGEVASHAITRPGYGPGKETVVFDTDDAVRLYDARHGRPDEPAAKPKDGSGAPESPLQLHVGSAAITPLGFMDFMGVWRSHTVGSGIGTNFAAIPYGDTYQTNLSEFRFSMQNSRIGFRVDADVKSSHVIGYMEADFLGNAPGNLAVSTNSNTLRSRLYWVDARMRRWELLAGQTWSLVMPGRSGISPLPGNLFFTQVIDPNYQLGLYWGRIPELRVVYHASSKAAFAVALGSPEQYIGGSAGGPLVTLPAALASTYSAELNNGTNNLGVPNRGPDLIAKAALDPSGRLHLEAGGLLRWFQLYDPTDATHHSATGGGGFASLHFELFKGFRVLANGFLSSGGGRYIFGQAPDLIARADGSPSVVKSRSTVAGLEYTKGNTLLYGYYGGLWVDRNVAADTDGKPIGYGYDGSPSSHNRLVQEISFGVSQTFWKDPKYGALNLMGQYSHLQRKPWSVAAGTPADASLDMVLANLRYTLPGSAPAVK